MTRWFRIPLTAAIVVAVVLLVAMAAGGANSTVFERYFPILLIVTSFATIALLAFIGAVVYRLFKQRRNKVFGSRMTINLALYPSTRGLTCAWNRRLTPALHFQAKCSRANSISSCKQPVASLPF